MSKMIAKGFGLTSTSNTQLPFTDVKRGMNLSLILKHCLQMGLPKEHLQRLSAQKQCKALSAGRFCCTS